MDTHESQLIVDGEMIIPLIVEFLVPPAWRREERQKPHAGMNKQELDYKLKGFDLEGQRLEVICEGSEVRKLL